MWTARLTREFWTLKSRYVKAAKVLETQPYPKDILVGFSSVSNAMVHPSPTIPRMKEIINQPQNCVKVRILTHVSIFPNKPFGKETHRQSCEKEWELKLLYRTDGAGGGGMEKDVIIHQQKNK